MEGYQLIEGVYVYFVTFTVKAWVPIFDYPEAINTIVESLRFCIANKSLRVHAYVIMPNHMHMIVSDANCDSQRLKSSLVQFRKYTGYELAKFVDANLDVSVGAVLRNGGMSDRQRQVWQPGWHAEAIVTEGFFVQKARYIHENPVRKGYVAEPEHWKHSSAGYWLNGEQSEIPIEPNFGSGC